MQLDTEAPAIDEPTVKCRPAKNRAPREHRGVLAVPPLTSAVELLEINARRRQTYNSPIADQTLRQLAVQARAELIDAALQYTSAYRPVPDTSRQSLVIMSGHQPELFHPGVWVKNYALDRIARDARAIAIHLLVDNDVVGAAEIQVPISKPVETRSDDEIGKGAGVGHVGETTAAVQAIALDDAQRPMPYEERLIVNATRFDQAGSQIAAAIAPLVSSPTVAQLWPLAVAARKRQTQQQGAAHLGLVLSEARHQLERDWGLDTLEVPLSRVCQGEAFRLFAAHLIEGLDALHTIYNQALIDYRTRNRLRSNSHPAPTLKQSGDFYEAPFWIWTADDPQRKPLYATRHGDRFVLQAGQNGEQWSLAGDGDPVHKLAHGMAALETERGIKIRPRALITTLFARLFLCDLFVHGIGGGEYDQVTDQLGIDFFGYQPPTFMVLSATMLLPCARVTVTPDDIRQIDGLLRELWYHPAKNSEQISPENSARFAKLALDKRSLLSRKPAKGQAKAWNSSVEGINKKLRSFLAENREALMVERNRLAKRLLADKILSSREYSFCLFAANTLRSALGRQVEQKICAAR